jgi:hypothetical protein
MQQYSQADLVVEAVHGTVVQEAVGTMEGRVHLHLTGEEAVVVAHTISAELRLLPHSVLPGTQ